jgi:tetratricopeptide (TPR) repeat protein
MALNPGQGNAWAFLGLCEAELDDPDQALSDIRKGEELGLGDNQQFALAVRVRAARLLIAGSDFDDAMAQLYPLAKLQEDSPAVVETMGLVVLGRGVQSIGALPAREREVVRAAGKAAWLAACQHPAEAAAAYKDLVAQYAGEPGVHYAIGLYLMETDLAAALEEFQKETQANPKHWPALIAGGTVQVRRGDAAAALLSLRQALQSAPAKYRWLCHSELGRAQMLAENVDAAVTELESAVRLMPAIPQVHFFLSQAYRRAGRAADAKRENAEFERLKAQQDPLGVPGLRGLGGK